MPPKKGIVKSGNAGNSSKPSSSKLTPEVKAEDKPLFPPGYKYPLSLLHERLQKNGWDKPNVDARKQHNGYSFIVTLSRKIKNETETVRLEPHPPYVLPTAIEARHWGATYALYRIFNGIQLNRVLPPGPREYWNELAAEHKAAPDHQAWMYDADPFAARRTLEERQEKAAKKREQSSAPPQPGATSPEFANAPEAKMGMRVRDIVENSIKQGFELYPEATEPGPMVLSDDQASEALQKLQALGFTPKQARRATQALSQPSQLATTFLSSLGPLQACLEYLILHIPECDLPQRFMPSQNSSQPFVVSTHTGSDDIKSRWLREQAVKQWGWPEHTVNDCTQNGDAELDWRSLLGILNHRLIGQTEIAAEGAESLDESELEVLGTERSSGFLKIPLPMAPIQLCIAVPIDQQVLPLSGDPPPMYVASAAAPAYVRLHLLSELLLAFRNGTLVEPGESVLMAAMRLLEEEWAIIQDDGPPEVSSVLQFLLPQADAESGKISEQIAEESVPSFSKGGPRVQRKDRRLDTKIFSDFETLQRNPAYKKLLAVREKLPAFKTKDQFLALLEKNRCVVVIGETGSGKTTQLPQFVLDALILGRQGSAASIIVTQPRRLSAIGVATRVSAERVEDGSVGYAIRGENTQTPHTKLLFCTTGIVLRRLASGDKLEDVTHVIVDEVHERSVDGDVLLLELKQLMAHHRNLKIILMSATINHETFVKYFNNAPLLTIPGLTHPVEDIYLEDVLPKLSYRPSSGGKGSKKTNKDDQVLERELSQLGIEHEHIRAIQAIARTDRIDFELVVAIVEHIVKNADAPAGILIFLPGVQDIRMCIESLSRIRNCRIFPLHANLSSDEQRAIFEPTSMWKIVVATNIAETSITIEDVVYVIDSGKVKETQYSPESGLTRLVEQWVTKAAAKQRRGRAGRTKPGFCYKLYTRAQERQMAAFPTPEIKRVALESVSLNVKVLHDDVKGFLARAIDPPNVTAIDTALTTLTELGALDNEGGLTAMGQHLAALPLDLRLGKMLILGTIFRCLEPVLTIAACLSSKPLFNNPMDKREEARRARERFRTANSDLLTDAHAYDECLKMRNEGSSRVRAFCEENFISPATVRDISSLRQDFIATLVSLNFIPYGSTPSSSSLNVNSSNLGLVKAVVLGGLWPRVARVSLPKGAIKFDRVQAGAVQRANEAREYRFYDICKNPDGQNRVFLHPSSILFHEAEWKAPFVVYFQKQMTSKLFLQGVSEVPTYALLLFGGLVSVNHIGGGLTIGGGDVAIKLKAWPRIGVLVNQLRQLLDIQLKRCVDQGSMLDAGTNNPVIQAALTLLSGDGLEVQ